MTGIEYLNSEDCPNIKVGMGLTQIQLYVIAGILEAYHKKQLIIDGVSSLTAKDKIYLNTLLVNKLLKKEDERKTKF